MRVRNRATNITSIGLLILCLVLPSTVLAKPKQKPYNNAAQDVFQAALRTARERHVVTFVDEKNLMLTFETGVSMLSYGFVANASVESTGESASTLIINVQKKNAGKDASFSFNAGDRMADDFFKQVTEELARKPEQKVAEKPAAPAVQIPPSPATTQPSSDFGTVAISTVPDGAEVAVDGAFVGNAPASLKLAPGKHTITVSQTTYKNWSKELSVLAGSEVKLNAALEKESQQ
jgi:hypothetical protein